MDVSRFAHKLDGFLRTGCTAVQAVRWVAFGLPPLDAAIEDLFDYPPRPSESCAYLFSGIVKADPIEQAFREAERELYEAVEAGLIRPTAYPPHPRRGPDDGIEDVMSVLQDKGIAIPDVGRFCPFDREVFYLSGIWWPSGDIELKRHDGTRRAYTYFGNFPLDELREVFPPHSRPHRHLIAGNSQLVAGADRQSPTKESEAAAWLYAYAMHHGQDLLKPSPSERTFLAEVATTAEASGVSISEPTFRRALKPIQERLSRLDALDALGPAEPNKR